MAVAPTVEHAPGGPLFGGLQAAAPLGLWWLDPATIYALGLVLIAAVYVGFAVADGRRTLIAVEAGIAAVFVAVAAAGVTGPAWLTTVLVSGAGERYSPAVAALLLGAWAVGALAAGVIALHRRDP